MISAPGHSACSPRFEAYLGGRWYAFDARQNQPPIGRAVVGYGRDAVEVALRTSYGAARLSRILVWASI